MTVLELVQAAEAKAYAPFARQVETGVALTPAQQDIILIAKVQAIIVGEVPDPVPPPPTPGVPLSVPGFEEETTS
jgi:hypothetical protein